MSRGLLAFAVGCLLLAAMPLAAQSNPTGLLDQTVNLRAAPDTRAEIAGQLASQSQVTLTGRDSTGRWLQVESDSGLHGWLPVFAVLTEADVLDLPVITPENSEAGSDVLIEAFGPVNVRSAPSVTADILGQLSGGEIVPALGRSNTANDWLLIALPDAPEQEGWVAYFAVGVRGDPNTLAVLAVDAGEEVLPPELLIRTLFNARLHPLPAIGTTILAVVPFDAQVEPIARTEDGGWLYVRYGSIVGWGAARLFDLPRSLADALPIFVPFTATPEAADEAASG